jgi:hypothetical protein
VAEGRVAEQTTPFELAVQELLDAVPGGQRDRSRIGLVRLDQYAAGRIAAAPPRQLRHELEGSFLGAKVGESHAGVRVDDRREGDTREVMALGDHLCAEEHGAFGAREATEEIGEVVRLGDGVGVEAKELQLRQPLRQFSLQALASGPEPGELRGATDGAEGWGRFPVSAMVAMQESVRVQRQSDVTALAPWRRSTRSAMERGRDTAPVEEEDGLAAPIG